MFSNLFKHIFRLSVPFSIYVFFALNISINVSDAKQIDVMLVSNTGLESGSGVLSYHAGTGEFMGSLDDPNENPLKLRYDIKRRYDQPKGLAVDSDGQIYVAYRCLLCDNTEIGAILKFSMGMDGRYLTQPIASGRGKEEGFEGLAISPDGLNLYAGQRETGRVIGYNAQRGELPIKTTFLHPRGLAFDSAGVLYVLSESKLFKGAGQISVIGKDAKPYLLVKPDTDGPLLLDDFSAGLTFGPDGDLYVVSTGRDIVLRYRRGRKLPLPNDEFQFPVEFAAPEKNRCVDPVGLAFGPHDQNLYVTCRTSNNIVRYDGRTGKFIDEFVRGGRFSKLRNPTYITFSSYDMPSPMRLKKPYNNEKTDPVTVFQWQRSENPEVHSYQLIIAYDPEMKVEVSDTPILKKVPQIALNLREFNLEALQTVYWRVNSLDQYGNLVGQSQVHCCILGVGESTAIRGLVTSDLTSLALSGAHVAVSTEGHAQTEYADIDTASNGEYNITARILEDGHIEITCTKEGFKPAVVEIDEGVNREITRNLVMIADSDGDGISDALENAWPCLDNNDADSDDDGIVDGDEDTNKNGFKESEETDPCRLDTDNDGIQDGTELSLTLDDIGSDTDTAIFQPDLDPSTKTNPLDNDSDKDGWSDGAEDLNNNGRVDVGETEPGFLNARALPAILPLLLGD